MPIPPRRPQQKSDNKMTTSDKYTLVEVRGDKDYDKLYHYELTLTDVREYLKLMKKSAFNHLHELRGPNNLKLVGYSEIQDYCYGNTGNKNFTFEEGTLSGAYVHPNLTIQKVGSLLEALRYNIYKGKHKLHLPDNSTLVGYDAIEQYYKQSTELPKIEDHTINPVLQEPVKTDFIREVDILRLVTEIQSLATKPGNEKRIHELSSVLKYVMEPESVPDKRQEVLYTVKFMNDLWHHLVEVLACDENEALDKFLAQKFPHTEIISITRR